MQYSFEYGFVGAREIVMVLEEEDCGNIQFINHSI